MGTTPEFLKTSEVAVLLRLDKRTVRRMAENGQLDSIKVGPSGKHRRYLAAQVYEMAGAGLVGELGKLERSLNAIPGVSVTVHIEGLELEGPGGGEQPSPCQPEAPPGPSAS